ncbi:hypothetical protein CBS101457_004676 [Exobasidium rhododendri]|nr:hypothetical protein CBS101457_004676 [Exobasidium rhododendri]
MSRRQIEIQSSFQNFQQEIDEYNDRRERLIKASRDITTASKRLIFHLHRFPHQSLQTTQFHDTAARSIAAEKFLSEAHIKRDEIVQLILQTSQREGFCSEHDHDNDEKSKRDVEIGRATRYERAIGSGLEEFVEAISFMHFLEHTSLITLAQVQALFMQGDKVLFPVPIFRYLLGLCDLTGELMRFATNAVGSGEAGDVVVLVLNLIRDLRSGLDPFVPLIKDMKKKQTVTTQSMRKIEDVSYAIKVRSSEFGTDSAALQEMVRRSLASDTRREEEGTEEGG